MFPTKQKLLAAEARVDFLVKSVEGLQDNISKLLTTNGELSASLTRAGMSLWEEQNTTKVLRDKCKELAEHIKRMNEVPTQFASGPLWMSEEEEDARYQHESGGLNGEMLREKLLELGLDPEITNEG